MASIANDKFFMMKSDSKENIREGCSNPYINFGGISGKNIASYNKNKTSINDRGTLHTQGGNRINRKITACGSFKNKDSIINYIDQITDLTSGISYVNKSSPKFVMNWAKERTKSQNRPSTTIDNENSDFQRPKWNNQFKSSENYTKERSKTEQRIEYDDISPKSLNQNNDVKISDEQINKLKLNQKDFRPQTCCDPGIAKSQRLSSLINSQSELNDNIQQTNFNFNREQSSRECPDEPLFQSINVKRDAKTGYQKKRAFPTNNRDFIYSKQEQDKRKVEPEIIKKRAEKSESTESFLAK